jgi:hypothetical protein
MLRETGGQATDYKSNQYNLLKDKERRASNKHIYPQMLRVVNHR